MNTNKIATILLFLLLTATGAFGQVKRKAAKRAKPTTVTPSLTPQQALFNDMLPATTKVMFIDSTVVDKDSIAAHIPIGKEYGLLREYMDVYPTSSRQKGLVYENEFRDKRYFSLPDADGHMQLYTAEKIGNRWSEPSIVADFGDELTDIACPFLMSDGLTLYFAGKGKNTLGGYDIFVTRFDTDNNQFYKPENIGLPYNSTADDYYYITAEADSLGWLVTARNQPEGKVCVYTFAFDDERVSYNKSNVDNAQLTALAQIRSIKDTWTDNDRLSKARRRLADLQTHRNKATGKQPSIHFVINDNRVYHSIEDFRSADAKRLYTLLVKKTAEKQVLVEKLDKMRMDYHAATPAKRQQMSKSILQTEQELQQATTDHEQLEKDIRKAELTQSTNKQ